ncbi:MAG TPA: trypsin-like peptidase domain-containing protein [candidate division Zixibacteria bacterium]|nr:trypsin-like peptidase domain-containing protein [candidate division Zixibacteria bacterium]
MHKLRNASIGLLLLTVLAVPAAAQISQGGTPVSILKSLPKDIPTRTMESINLPTLLVEDSLEAADGLPYRFGYPFDVKYNLSNSGRWDELEDGSRVWRLRISAPGAYSINLLYDRFVMPKGARMWVYSEDQSMIIGAFTELNNKSHGEFSTAPVKGDVTIVEYYEPVEVLGQGEVSISRIVHAYRDIFNYGGTHAEKDYGESGYCNNNINCSVGDDWQNEKRGVAMVLLSGGYRWCSGSLVNNVRQDQTPYFLTANHCLGSESTWLFMFKYESPTCTNQDGPTGYTISGSTLRASNSTADFGLVQLSQSVPDNYDPYYNGWSNINTAPTSSVAIHHPSGDIKKISFDYDAATSADYLETSGTTHWRIIQWDDGTTEGGSSGSPLFDQNHRVVGQLHGGYASCYSLTSDWYGKFSLSWSIGSSSSGRLRDWLDPDNTGATTLDGLDPFAGITIDHTPLIDTRDTLNSYRVEAVITSASDLIEDSLLVYYNAGSGWQELTMIPGASTDEFYADIPAQSPGDSIYYYIHARDLSGHEATTDTYSFRVIDYEMTVMPEALGDSALYLITVWYRVAITNTGLYEDTYDLDLSGYSWASAVFDENMSLPLTEIGPIPAGDTGIIMIAVDIESNIYGDQDMAQLTVTSDGDPSITDSRTFTTMSLGSTSEAPWSDYVENPTVDEILWVVNQGVESSTEAQDPPSGPYALNFDGGNDTLVSQPIDISAVTSGYYLSYGFERGGNGSMPSAGDDLSVDIKDQIGTWIEVANHSGDGSRMTAFEYNTIEIPSSAYDTDFQIRFRSEGDCVGCDDWFVDDIRVDFAPVIDITPTTVTENLISGDSTQVTLNLGNIGDGDASYSLGIQLDLTPTLNNGNPVTDLEPATHEQPALDGTFEDIKGVDYPDIGAPVLYDAGGPDEFGYFWIDSDDPDGPVFSWVNATVYGENITSGIDDDNYLGPFDIGFSFPFYDGSYNQLYIGSNGLIGFTAADLDTRYKTTIPTAATPNNMICWLWDDLDPTDGDNTDAEIWIDTTGGRCVVSFIDYPEYGASAGDVITAQVILDQSGSITLQYLTIAAGFDANSGTVGIENYDGSDGLEIAYATSYLHDNLAVLIAKPSQWLHVDKVAGQIEHGLTDYPVLTLSAAALDTGSYSANVIVSSNDPNTANNPWTIPITLTVTSEQIIVCGDVNNDGSGPDISDLVYLVAYMFSDGPAPEVMAATDVNGSGSGPDISDLVYLVTYMFQEGPALNCP